MSLKIVGIWLGEAVGQGNYSNKIGQLPGKEKKNLKKKKGVGGLADWLVG